MKTGNTKGTLGCTTKKKKKKRNGTKWNRDAMENPVCEIKNRDKLCGTGAWRSYGGRGKAEG